MSDTPGQPNVGAPDESPTWRPKNPLAWFFGCAALLFVLRAVLAYVALPPAAAAVASVFTTGIFIVVPFAGLFCGAAFAWKPPQAWILTLAGVVLHGGSLAALQSLKPPPATALVLGNFMQIGMLGWTLGLGALVSILIRERNMLLPIAIFLAGMDALLILTPFTPQAQIAMNNPQVVGNLGLKVPAVKSIGAEQLPLAVNDILFVGPADLFISAMFFAAMFRYGLRARQTATWLIPVLVGYLFLVLLTQMPLPALVPIGLTALIVNWKEFRLSKDEKAATGLVLAIALAMAAYGAYAKATYKPPKPPAGSLPSPDGQAPGEPGQNTGPTLPGPHR